MPSPWLTLYVAIYAAVVATLSFLWNVWRAREERGRVRLRVRLGHTYVVAPGNFQKKEPCLSVEAVNMGKDCVRVKAFAAEAGQTAVRKSPASFCLTDALNFQIEVEKPPFKMPVFPWVIEGKDRIAFALQLSDESFKPDYKSYFVEDTTSRRWHTSWWEMWRLRQAIGRLKSAK